MPDLNSVSTNDTSPEIQGGLNSSNNSDLNITHLSDEVVHPFQDTTESRNGLNGSFKSVEQLLYIASSMEPTHSTIPQGIRQNVLFVLNDTENTKRCLLKKKQSEYTDDCGGWDSEINSTKTNYYTRN